MTAGTATGTTVAETNLKAGSLRLPSIFMQSLTMVAPGIAALFYTPVVVAQAGLAAPLAYPIAFVIVLLTAIVLAQLARAVPGAGGYYNYVSRGINPTSGFLVSWLNLIYAPLVLGAVTVFGGWVIASSLEWTGVARDWFPIGFSLVIVTIVAIIQFMGVQLSGKTLVITGGIELIVVGILGLWGLANPGPGGLNVQPFNPANASSISGLFIAAVFAIQAFTGWEGAAPMAEESENPTRNVPRALIGSVILFGVFIVIVQWGVMIGWGTDNFAAIPKSPELPGIVLAKQFWGVAWGILLVMLVSSVIAVSIACANVSTRMWYRMGTDGAFPKWFGRVHPTRKTPVNAIIAQWVLAIATALGLTALAAAATPVPEGASSVPSDLIYQNQYYIDGVRDRLRRAHHLHDGQHRRLSPLPRRAQERVQRLAPSRVPDPVHPRDVPGAAVLPRDHRWRSPDDPGAGPASRPVEHPGALRRRVVRARGPARAVSPFVGSHRLDGGGRRGRIRTSGYAGGDRGPQGRVVRPTTR